MSTTTRRRWGVPVSQHMQRFGRRGENGPKNNAAAAAALCGFRRVREKERERGRDRPPHSQHHQPPSLFPENQLSIRPTVVFLPDLPPHRSSSHPSPLVVARPRSGAAQGRSASSSHGVGREFTGAVGGRGLLVWGWGGSAECWWWGRTLTKPISEDFSRKH